MKNGLAALWGKYINTINTIVLSGIDSADKDIAYWKNKVFTNILIYILPVSILALVPGMVMSFSGGLILLGVYDLLAFTTVLFIALAPGIPIMIRKGIFIATIYCLSLVLLYYLGSFGPAMMYLLVITIITSIIFSSRLAYLGILINIVLCIFCAILIGLHYPDIPLVTTYSVGSWIADTSNLLLLSVVSAACHELLITGFKKTLLERKVTEEKFILNESRLRKAQEVGQLGYWQQEINAKEIWASEQAMKIYGFPAVAGSLPTHVVAACIPDIDKVRMAAIGLFTRGAKYDITFQINPADGSSPKTIWAIAELEMDEEGNAARITGVLQDITETRKAEKEIKDSEEKRRLIMNAALDAIICIDTKGDITFWNPQAEKIFGWKQEEVNGRNMAEVIVPPAFRQMHNNGIDHYLLTGQGPALNVLLELRAVKRDGTEFPIELTVLPIKQEAGEFFCAFIRDITKRKKDEAAILISNERYDLVSKATNDCIWDWDMITNINTRGNKRLETLLGYPPVPPEEVTAFWNIHAHPDDWRHITEKRNAIFADPTQSYWEGEYRFIRADGSYAYVYDRGYIIRNNEGKPIRMIGASHDISERKQNEESLRNSELRFRSLIEKGSEIIAMHDSKGILTYISPAVQNLLGYTPEQRVGLNAFDAVHPDDIAAIRKTLSELMKSPGAYAQAQWRHKHADGSWRWMDGVATNLLDVPAVNAVVHNFRDISAQKKVEEKLKEERNLLRTLVDNMPDAIFIKDIKGRRIVSNAADFSIFGATSQSEILGKTVLESLPGETGQSIYEDDLRVINTGKPILNKEIELVNSLGEHIWILSSRVPLLDENKVVAGLLGINRDITERKEIEIELRKSNERFELVNQATFDAIWDWDLVTDHIYWGQGFEKIFGHIIKDLPPLSTSWSDFIFPDERGEVLAGIHKFLDGQENNWMAEYRFLKADGTYAFVRDKGVAVRDSNGKAIRMIGAIQDITKRKQVEDQLNKNHNELKRLSAYLQQVREEERKYIAREVHDELGQLASALKIDIDWLNLKLPDLAEAGKNRMEHANKTIAVLITSIRKIASSLRPSILDDFGLNAALQWHCNEFQQLNGIECIFVPEFDDRDLSMEMKTEMFRITQESLTNVMRHAKATLVNVNISEDTKSIHLVIKDNGNGFDVNKRKNTLGLIGLRERAISLQGELIIESRIGKGTTISAVIPKKVSHENSSGR